MIRSNDFASERRKARRDLQTLADDYSNATVCEKDSAFEIDKGREEVVLMLFELLLYFCFYFLERDV